MRVKGDCQKFLEKILRVNLLQQIAFLLAIVQLNADESIFDSGQLACCSRKSDHQ